VKRLAGGAVLDASVGVKLVVAEAGHERARAVLERAVREEAPMAVPEFMALEVANALWAKARRRRACPSAVGDRRLGHRTRVRRHGL
jgi:predicted nucleic acid-binding protein